MSWYRMIVRASMSAAVLAALQGCDRTSQGEENRHLENPPPIPPHCPDLPELENVTLMDGTVADVRIVQFRSTKLYVPADLIRRSFYDAEDKVHKLFEGSRFYIPHGLMNFIPDMQKKECPGVIHHIRTDGNSVSKGFVLLGYGLNMFGRNISPKSSIINLQFHLIDNHEFRDNYSYPYLGYETANVKIFDDVISHYNTSYKKKHRSMIGSPEWIMYRESVEDFSNWLTMPPRRRDNKRVFILGVEKVVQ